MIGSIYPTLTMINEKASRPLPGDLLVDVAGQAHLDLQDPSGPEVERRRADHRRDVAWTFNLIMHNQTAATANGSLVANFASVTAPNATTLVITTKQPEANML